MGGARCPVTCGWSWGPVMWEELGVLSCGSVTPGGPPGFVVGL